MKNIDICFGVDSSYVPYMGATITSLLINEDACYHITFHVITSDITEDDKNKILSLKEIRDFNINYYVIDTQKYEKWFEKIHTEYHFKPSIFFRLSIPEVLRDIDKVLYTDCDVIYTKSIGHLFEENIDNYYAIVMDGDDILKDEKMKRNDDEYKKNIGLSSDDKTFSSGFMLINNKLWIDSNIEQDFMGYAGSRKVFHMPDVDILNYTLAKRKLKYIPLTYNFFSHKDFYNKDELPNI